MTLMARQGGTEFIGMQFLPFFDSAHLSLDLTFPFLPDVPSDRSVLSALLARRNNLAAAASSM
jgi:hypothetical protein